jgi:Secretion system C-terminal sorting domain
MRKANFLFVMLLFTVVQTASFAQIDPDTAMHASIDRFSMDAGHLFVRDSSNGLPGPNMPVNFDVEPFRSMGLGPNGEYSIYYNFDVQPTTPAPIFVLFQNGTPVAGQLNIVGVIPGEVGYNDFWQVNKVDVPSNYVANTIVSTDQVLSSGYTITPTTTIVNCPIVPDGSTAMLRYSAGEDNGLSRGWYDSTVVFYFNFAEAPIMTDMNGMVPVSDIYVSFNINPGLPGGGPPSGFMTDFTGRTHNVPTTLPGNTAYSPLWDVNIYDNADFDMVHDLMSAQNANILVAGAALVNCPIVSVSNATVFDPDTTMHASIDRFSMAAGHLFVRDSSNGLPGPNMPVNFDMEPFRSMGLGPNGEFSTYYNFDVQSTTPAPIFVLFREGESSPVQGQSNIVGVIPGDVGYNDFWLVNKVTVPADYVANTVVSTQQILDSAYTITPTSIIVNCPIVPDGSSAMMRYHTTEDTSLSRGWYDSTVVYYFNFAEAPIMTDMNGMVPVSDIYVTFNINPGEPGGGPPSGFMTDSTGRTHNVPATLPGNAVYSPLWDVNIYDNADFNMVHDLMSAENATILVAGAALVNCPIVYVSNATAIGDNQTNQPTSYKLEQNYPNPFNPSTKISFNIAQSGFVSLKVYDALGREVATLVNEVTPAGNHIINFNASDLASGIYFYRLKTGNFTESRKMILLK